MQLRKLYTITEFITSFRQALCAIVPIAEGIGITWKEPDNYDEWDFSAKGLYEGFVLVGVRSSNEGSEAGLLPLVRYDERISDYSQRSYVAASWQNEICPVICLETASVPFDMCLLAKLDENGTLLETIQAPFDACKFSAVIKNSSRTMEADSLSF